MGSLLMRKNRISPCKAYDESFSNSNVERLWHITGSKIESEVKLKLDDMHWYNLPNRELRGKCWDEWGQYLNGAWQDNKAIFHLSQISRISRKPLYSYKYTQMSIYVLHVQLLTFRLITDKWIFSYKQWVKHLNPPQMHNDEKSMHANRI